MGEHHVQYRDCYLDLWNSPGTQWPFMPNAGISDSVVRLVDL
jgi:hypothetical protein